MKAKSAIFYSPIFLEHETPFTHPEQASRLQSILSTLQQHNILEKIPIVEPAKASINQLKLVHSKTYIKSIEKLSAAGGGFLDPDTVVSPRSFIAASYAGGACIKAVDEMMAGSLEKAFCLVRPPGHHARKTQGMGFCLFNNAAIAAKWAIKNHHLNRVAIIDFDAHHGNGTQEAFYENERVLYVSLHQYPHYPGTGSLNETGAKKGVGFNLNFPFPPLAGNEVYTQASKEVIKPVLKQFQPELIIVSAGYDSHLEDSLSQLQLTEKGFGVMAQDLKRIAAQFSQGRILVCLEGGYNLYSLGTAFLKTLAVLSDIKIELKEMYDIQPELGQSIVEKCHQEFRKFWKI